MSLLPRFLATILPLFLLAQPAAAEIVKIAFKDEKTEKKHAKYLTVVGGRKVLLAEVVSGVTYGDGTVTFDPGRCEFFIADPKDPEAIPYKMKKGERVPTSKKFLVGIPGAKIEWIRTFDRNESFAGLTREYAIRKEIIDGILEERDAEKKGSAEWFRHHTRYLAGLKSLRSWLSNTAYGPAAAKLDKQITKQEKVIGKEAGEYRLKNALASITDVETPEDLAETANELTQGISTYKIAESLHIRIIYPDDVETPRVHKLLELAETIIDGFRLEYVDPYVDVVDFQDRIPDRIVHEYFFTPIDNKRLYENFLTEYYGKSWGKNKERMLESNGSSHTLSKPVRALSYSMLQEDGDLEGRVAHALGHTLAELHYNKGAGFERQAWIPEAVGYFVSFEFLGRNSVTCFQYREPDPTRSRRGKRENAPGEDGEKTAMMGMRDIFNELALAEGPKIDALALMTLSELSNADFAKAWSFYDFIVRRYGKKGQEWLRIGAKASHDPKKMVAEWREASEEIFEIEGQDVFKWIDQEWRKYAENDQDKSADGK